MRRCFGIHVIGSFFLSALLPPRDDAEQSFYEVLGLVTENRTTDEQLRKAYRKLSLKFHPDKIAQRGGDAEKKEAAAAEYERIQEAYHVLIHEKKRLKYDALGTPTRYRFVERGGFADPQSLFENLVGSSFEDKSRLVGLFGIAILLVLMQPILIAAKVNQSLRGEGPLENSSWFAILIPFWVVGGLFIIFTFAVAAFFVASTRDRLPICLTGLEHFFWYLGIIFLCYKWDETWDDSVRYQQALGPIYFAMILRWSRSFLTLQNVRKDVNRMVTSECIEKELLKRRSMDELSEEEQEEIKKAFLVVSVDPEFEEPPPGELTDEELEAMKVESSSEYESAIEIYRTTFNGLASSLFFGCIFLILLTLKLDGRLSGNWWAVFSPFWIERGGRLLINLFKCCCGGIYGDEVVVYAGVDLPTDAEVNTGDNDKESSKDDKIEEASAEDATKTPSSEKKSSDEIKTNISLENNDDTIGDSSKDDKKPETTLPADGVDGNGGEGDDDDDDGIELEEDTYFDFEDDYHEAEKDAKNERAQSCSESVGLIIQIILLCLVVAKIDKNFDNVDRYPGDVGFNVFWILFPFFLFFGLTLCCCALLIFGAAPEQPEGETDQVEYDPENPPMHNDNDENQGGDSVVAANPSKEEETAVEAVVAEENTVDELTSEKSDPSNAPSDNNMDDLD